MWTSVSPCSPVQQDEEYDEEMDARSAAVAAQVGRCRLTLSNPR